MKSSAELLVDEARVQEYLGIAPGSTIQMAPPRGIVPINISRVVDSKGTWLNGREVLACLTAFANQNEEVTSILLSVRDQIAEACDIRTTPRS